MSDRPTLKPYRVQVERFVTAEVTVVATSPEDARSLAIDAYETYADEIPVKTLVDAPASGCSEVDALPDGTQVYVEAVAENNQEGIACLSWGCIRDGHVAPQ